LNRDPNPNQTEKDKAKENRREDEKGNTQPMKKNGTEGNTNKKKRNITDEEKKNENMADDRGIGDGLAVTRVHCGLRG
jgi:hypothetical protein